MHSIAQDASGMQENFKGGKAMAKKRGYYVRPDGLHETSRTINGKRVVFRGRTDREVDQKILAYQEERQRGRAFPTVADEWYKEHEQAIRYSTYRVYGFALDRLKAAFPGDIREIKPLDCKRYLTAFEKQGYAKNTVQIELTVMKQIFRHAVLAGDLDVSPAAEVQHGKHLPRAKRGALTEEQEQKVAACREGDFWLFGLMLLYTGLRRGELLALNWQDIDRKAGVIHVNKKINYAYGTPHLEQFLKSDNGLRDVPILDELAEALPKVDRLGPIFCNDRGEYLSASQLHQAWRRYCKAAGLTVWDYDESGKPVEIPAITPHCLRHSFATILYEAGLDPKSAAALVGDTEQVVQGVYQELRNGKKQTDAAKINAYLETRKALRAAEM